MWIPALALLTCSSACADTTAPGVVAVNAQASVAAVPESISVTAVCPGRFVVRNRDTVDVVVNFVMTPSSLNRNVFVPARATLLGWSEAFITFAQAGQMTALVDGRQIASQAYGLTPACPVLTPPPNEVPLTIDSMVFINAGEISGAPEQPFNRLFADLVWVDFAAGTSSGSRSETLALAGGIVMGGMRNHPPGGLLLVRLLHGDGTAFRALRAVELIRRRPGVTDVHAAWISHSAPSYVKPRDGVNWINWQVDRSAIDPSSQTWFLEDVRAPLAWGCSVGSDSVPVAVLDSWAGNQQNMDLIRNTTSLWVSNTRAFPPSDAGHAAAVAGVLAARGNDSSGITGMAWRAGLRLVDRLSDPASDQLPAVYGKGASDDAIEGHLVRVAREGAKVVNMSFNTGFDLSQQGLDSASKYRLGDPMAKAVVRALNQLDSSQRPLLVISAGNRGENAILGGTTRARLSFPNNVIVVGASTSSGALAPFSNFGPLVDVAAPGTNITVYGPPGAPVHAASGTSEAAPLVSGIATLLFAFDPTLTPAQVKQYIVQGAQRSGRMAGSIPIVDAYESLKLAAMRKGAPLCGNRMWYRQGRVIVQRGDSLLAFDDTIARFDTTLTTNDAGGFGIYATHGGKYVTNLRDAVEWRGGSWQVASGAGPDQSALETSGSIVHNDVSAGMVPIPSQGPRHLQLQLYYYDGRPTRNLMAFNGSGVDGPEQNVVMPTFGSRLVLMYLAPTPPYQARITWFDTLTNVETPISPSLPSNFLGTISGSPSADGLEFSLTFNTSPNAQLSTASCVTEFRSYATGAVNRTITTLGRCGFGVGNYSNLVATGRGGSRRPRGPTSPATTLRR